MIFSSMTFLWVFLPCVILGYVLIKPSLQNAFLVIASLIFYAWGEPTYVALMIFSIVANWIFGLAIERFWKYKKAVLIGAVIFNLGILGFYKYYVFFAENINALLGKKILCDAELPLPIGISFFTFQIMSYLIDLYRGHYTAQKNIVNLALYISFFPQLIAGPIVRYKEINEQIEHRTITIDRIACGFRRFAYGLGKKVLISNILAETVEGIYGMDINEIGTAAAWLAAILYTMQIYYDFSGYSDMAIGLGKIFGFDFSDNFNYPYISASIHEFWQRWHISLGTWFKEYVYIPLGGNRKGKLRTYINLLIVFLLTGFWHGASWNFVFWGVYYAFFQIIERLGWEQLLKKTKLLKHIYTMVVVTIGWVFFYNENIITGIRLVVRMFMPWRHPVSWSFDESNRVILAVVLAVLGCGMVQFAFQKCKKVSALWKNSVVELLFCVGIMLLSFVSLASNSYNPFIYFRF